MSKLLKKPVKIALVQLASGPFQANPPVQNADDTHTGADKSANLLHAQEKVREAAKAGAGIIVLPECFNSPYGCDYFPSFVLSQTLCPSI
jgi:hypothetical protein